MPMLLSRRSFLRTGAATGTLAAGSIAAPSIGFTASRPQITHDSRSDDVGLPAGIESASGVGRAG